MYFRTTALGVAMLAACSPGHGEPADGSSATGPSTTTHAVATEANDATTDEPPPMPATTSADDSSTSSTEGTTTEAGGASSNFIVEPDGGSHWSECDFWAQDCPSGEKCMPWSNDGGGSWNALRCSPVADAPGDVGESCTVVGSGVSGVDDCTLDAMCWNVDPETNLGECVAFCQGTEGNPTCVDPCTVCNIPANGVVILCLPDCDPLLQDCYGTQGCYPIDDTFTCVPDASGDEGAIGSPCAFLNVCDGGNFCADQARVPDCGDETGCCAPFCNVDAPDECDALLPGTTCVPWYENGQNAASCRGPGTVGGCLLPG